MVTAEATEAPKKEQQRKETLSESIAGFASVFVVGLFIITFVIQHFEIPSGSMENTLLIGDHVFVDRLVPTGKHGFPDFLMPYRELHRGEIAVFVSLAEPGLYLVKRIVGVPGDRIHLQDGKVYLNGVRQAEPYVLRDGSYDPYRDNFPAISPLGDFQIREQWAETLPGSIQNGDLVIPRGHYFAMGDNRDNSYDSRYWGFVPQQNIMGRPLFIAWSLKQDESDFAPKAIGERVTSFLSTAFHFFAITRWKRVMRLVH
ncbi:MAG: signal peptidase I [Candidatus Angelobacter sp.]